MLRVQTRSQFIRLFGYASLQSCRSISRRPYSGGSPSWRQLIGTSDGEEDSLQTVPVHVERRDTRDATRVKSQGPNPPLRNKKAVKEAYIALGSNVGHRVHNIESACRLMSANGTVRVVDTGLLYETEPMYHLNQGTFINTVVIVQTELQPLELLHFLQSIEKRLGREKTIVNGPRSIDLDILYYGGDTIYLPELQVPHPRILERSFVLWPLRNLTGSSEYLPAPHHNVRWTQLDLEEVKMQKALVIPFGPNGLFLRPALSSSRASLMAILNVTPDSFSDGGAHEGDGLLSLVANAASTSTIIDVGGQSTRPGAEMICVQEELDRVIPAIQQIRKHPFLAPNLVISIDTFRADVARAALNAGAHIVNDISGAYEEPSILEAVAQNGATIILGHARGQVKTMHDPAIRAELGAEEVMNALQERVTRAVGQHMFRWRIWVDPGFGFSKTKSSNLRLLRDMQKSYRVPDGDKSNSSQLSFLPWVAGFSRKAFIGSTINVEEPNQREMGNAVALAATVMNGFDIIRVHDPLAMKQALDMANALWRSEDCLR